MPVQQRKYPEITEENAKAFLKSEKENEEKLKKRAEQIKNDIEKTKR